jgi:hypothetical protein
MSKGTGKITFRIPAALESEIDRAINRHNANPGTRDSLNRTSFLLRAIKEKISHLERSRKKISRAKRVSCHEMHKELGDFIAGPHHDPQCVHYRPEAGAS